MTNQIPLPVETLTIRRIRRIKRSIEREGVERADPFADLGERGTGERIRNPNPPTSQAVPQPSTRPVPGTLTPLEAQTRQLTEYARKAEPGRARINALLKALTDPVRATLPEHLGGLSPEEAEFVRQSLSVEALAEMQSRPGFEGLLGKLQGVAIAFPPGAVVSGGLAGLGRDVQAVRTIPRITRQVSAEALVRVPQRQVQEAGLRLAGAKPTAGGGREPRILSVSRGPFGSIQERQPLGAPSTNPTGQTGKFWGKI